MLRGALAAIMVLCACLGAAHAQALHPLPRQPAGLAWPTRDWAVAPLPADLDHAAYDLAVTEAFAGAHPLFGETRALIVVQGGRIVFERYGEGYGRDMRMPSWSMAKSITQALVGAAVLQGRVAIDAPMGSPHWSAGDRRASITWRQWLNMVDGQTFTESGDAAHLLYGRGRNDTARYAAQMPLLHSPGTHWNDSSAATMLIADALSRGIVANPRDASDRRARMRAWMQQSLFGRIGMTPVVEFDASGLFMGSDGMWATARDYARFGYLYLRGGVWDGARVLPEGWADFARSPGTRTNIYGAHWWLTPADHAMADAFSAQGRQGQLILVVPSKDLVLVRLGYFDGGAESWDALGDWATRMAGAFGDRDTGVVQ
jgi:CubicO group peptidase (beta-lactamase class C family)